MGSKYLNIVKKNKNAKSENHVIIGKNIHPSTCHINQYLKAVRASMDEITMSVAIFLFFSLFQALNACVFQVEKCIFPLTGANPAREEKEKKERKKKTTKTKDA